MSPATVTRRVREALQGSLQGSGLPRLTPRSPRLNGEGFSINLVRHEVLPRSVRRLMAYAALGYLAVHALFLMGFLGTTLHHYVARRQLQARFRGQTPITAPGNVLKREMRFLNERASGNLVELNTIATLQRQQFPIGGKLAALSRTLPDRTWITSVSGKREDHSVTVQANYLINEDQPYDVPTKQWMEALRADPSFSTDLRRIDVGTSSRKKSHGEAELFSFELNAGWK